MSICFNFFASFLGSLCFCFLFNVPKRNVLLSALCGGLSWSILVSLQNMGFDSIFSSLIAAVIIGLISEILAIIIKTPVTSFIVIGIIPLVPGFKVYKTMLFFVSGKLQEGTTEGVQAMFIAISISVGLIISTSIFKFVKIIRRRRELNKI